MSPYIETIRIQDGEIKNLSFHQARFERTRRLELGLEIHPDLKQLIKRSKQLEHGLIKCRITYGMEVEGIKFEPYSRQSINSLKIVEADHISYGFKYANRKDLETLYAQRESFDDILIIKNGCVTDSYFANTAFWDGKLWFTPDTPLLPGTMRASLLAKGVLKNTRITVADLANYHNIRLINAMNDLDEAAEILMENVTL
jgi:4-amino-4-deoxychorismate lyase